MRMEIQDLANEVDRQKKNSRDIVIDSAKIHAEVYREGDPNTGVGLVLEGGYPLPLTEWAHHQLADKTGIPERYYDRMLGNCKYDLVTKNVNTWIGDKERRLVRILDGNVRAILSDRYRPMDNYDLLYCALEEFKEHGVQIHRCDLTETYMFVKVVVPHEEQEVRMDDKVIPGLILSNSEVGAGSFKVEPFMLRLLCLNGMIGEQVIRKIHIGERRGEGDIWSDDTLRLKDQALWSEARDVISATFDPEIFTKWVEKVREGTEVPVESPTLAVNSVAARYNLSEEKKTELLDYFVTKETHTQWGLANAVTRIARDIENVETQVDLERAGNVIALLPEKEFKKLTTKKEEEEEAA